MKNQHKESGMSDPQYLLCIIIGFVAVWLLTSSVGCITAEQLGEIMQAGSYGAVAGAASEAGRQLSESGGITSGEAIGGAAIGGILAVIAAIFGRKKVKAWRKNGNQSDE